MNENETVGFEDFESALFGGDYQIDGEGEFEEHETDDTEDGDVIDDTSDDDIDSDSEAADEAESDETESDEKEPSDPDEDAEEATDKAETSNENDQQTFTIKVNKEEKTVTLDEMTALAQKGADYDRVKENYAKSQQNIQELQEKLNAFTAHQSALDILNIVAEKTGASIDQLAESIYVNLRKSAGTSEDAAREELKTAKLEKKLNAYEAREKQPEDDAESRAKRDMEEFQKEYPDVQVNAELIKNLTEDIQKGMSLSAAYRKYERQQSAAKIAELERKLAAKAQNEKNKSKSPGSQKDSGGRRTRSDYDDFEKALFG